ncbi:MAG: hypothetical protein V3U33_06420 [candidate division NC10 bacterium]
MGAAQIRARWRRGRIVSYLRHRDPAKRGAVEEAARATPPTVSADLSLLAPLVRLVPDPEWGHGRYRLLLEWEFLAEPEDVLQAAQDALGPDAKKALATIKDDLANRVIDLGVDDYCLCESGRGGPKPAHSTRVRNPVPVSP